ncbi:peptide chain release factor aRF-1 [Candidatus Micrarchaeota archaeon]|nr:peptide chain release factor aRF-1 [Candidatus Micrarchaeota archaeon]MBU1166741.1 peptide chain release factor aRF-1 [Candidatus Micrarchaeota archaeon]MBU1886704.1 peptide chain release factor aRF-1 [Candidatus Micrarchaeota archaeon]
MADSDKMYTFKKQLRNLQSYRGNGTELISVYIPAGSQVHDMSNKLREEMSQASNIKSKSTKTNVLGALERIANYLKIFKKPPANGISVFAGNVSDNVAKVDIELFSLEPPEPLKIGAYRCDSKFFLEPLEQMLGSSEMYGIVVMDGREATIATVKGTIITIIKKLNSTAHAKVNKGGQSQRRYQRLVEEQIENYYKRIGESMDDAFVNRAKAVVVGGPGPAKEGFMKLKPYNYQINVLGVVDTGYTDEYGVREVLSKSEDILLKQEAIKEKALVERFIKEVVNDGLATYGVNEVRNAILAKQAEKVIISENLQYMTATYTCLSCNSEEKKTFREKIEERTIKCKKCGEQMKLKSEELLIDELMELSRANNIEVEIVSDNTTEGAQLLTGFGGIGAFLRYRNR